MARKRGIDDRDVPDAEVRIRDFGGWAPHGDPHDLPAGVSARQINVMSWRPGELRVRPGFVAVRFDAD